MVEWSLANLAAWAVQAAAIVALGVWLPMRLRLGAPRARLALFRALLIACVALPLVQPWRPASAPVVPEAEAVPSIELPAAIPSPAVSPSPAPAAASAAFSIERVRAAVASLPWAAIALVILLAGVAVRLAWLGVGLVSLARLRRSSSSIDAETPAVLEATRVVGARASFRQSPRVRHPVTFGLRKPVVLVPPGFTALDPLQQLAIACHELLHVRRQDWLRALGDELARALLWFHPAIWWLVEQIRLSAEQLIDREVVGLVGDRRSYLRALLALAEAGAGARYSPAPCFLDHGHLQKRVAMLMEEVSMSRLRLVVSAALVFAVLVTGGWAVVRAFPLQAAAVVSQLPVPPAPPVPPVTPPPPPPPPPPAAAKAVTPVAPALPQQPQAAPRPGMMTPSPKVDEATLKQNIQANPKETANYFLLAKLYENAGNLAKAVGTLEAAVRAVPKDEAVYLQLAGFHNRQGEFDKTMDALTRWAAVEPANPLVHYTMAAYYWEKAYRDGRLTDAEKRDYISRGLAAADQAIALNPEYMEALTYKNLLLRSQALLESDTDVQKRLIAEADTLRNRAIEIRKSQPQPVNAGGISSLKPDGTRYTADEWKSYLGGKYAAAQQQLEPLMKRYSPDHPDVVRARKLLAELEAAMAAGPPPPPPPPPPPMKVSATAPVPPVAAPPLPPPPVPPAPPDSTASGARIFEKNDPGLTNPIVISEVRPTYTPEAMRARIEGTVSLSCVVETDGTVRDVTVLTSLDQVLDEQAIIAARKWRFHAGTKDGKPVRVRVELSLTFTLRD
jgi:TonB family protein